MSTKLTYTGAEVQELLDKIGKGDFDNAKTLEGHPASYFAVASELTYLAESFATEQGRINTLCSYFNNGSANDALSLGGQLPSYYATALQYEILQQTLTDFKSLFDSMFEKDSDGNIHAKLSLWSSGGITAGDAGSGGSGGGGISYNRLDSWADYSADKAGYVLSALLGKDLDDRVSALANAGYITQSALAPYVLRSEVEGQYLSKNGGTINGSITATSFIGNLTGNAGSATYILTKLTSGDAFSPDRYKAYIQWVSGDTAVMKFTDGDYQFCANSATKLQTPRTIWGQSFDGTGDVNGDLFLPNNKTIYAFASDNSNAFHVASLGSDDIMRYGYASKVSHIRGNSVHLLYGSSHTTGFVLNSSGNVGIGGATADEKLHVYGNGKFTGALTANSLTIGGATITYDSVNEALCINGNMYALGGITAGGAGVSAYTSLEARVARLEQQLNIS